MRKLVKFSNIDEIVDDTFDEDEKKHARKYLGEYVLKTMNFEQTGIARFKALKFNPNNPQDYSLDAWANRLYGLLYSLEKVTKFGERPPSGWSGTTFYKIEQYIKNAPNSVGEKLLEASDEVNGISEKAKKNLS